MGTPPLTPLDQALESVVALGLDTAPFIYFIERHQVYGPPVREVFQRVDAGVIRAYTSVITLTEVLTVPHQAGADDIRAAYRRLLQRSRNLTLLSIDPPIADLAADLRVRHRLRTPDALQIAAALLAGCQAFLTNDTGLRRVTELRVLVLDDLLSG